MIETAVADLDRLLHRIRVPGHCRVLCPALPLQICPRGQGALLPPGQEAGHLAQAVVHQGRGQALPLRLPCPLCCLQHLLLVLRPSLKDYTLYIVYILPYYPVPCTMSQIVVVIFF